MRRHLWPLAAVTTLAVVLSPTVAQAATKSVFAGPPRPVKSLPEGVDLAHFFPKKIKVARGDKIEFHFRGFHTVTFFGKSKREPFAISDGQKISGVNDAAGNPFWFNGQNRLLVNPDVFLPAGDAKVDNRALENSGFPEGGDEGPPPPYTAEFPKVGTFKYLCQVHPKMAGRVTVVRNRRNVPSERSDQARAAKEVAKLTRIAKRRAAFDGPGGANVRAGNDTNDLEIIKFFPENVTIRAGGTVRWFVAHPHEFHTVTFGPGSYLEPIGQGFIAPDTNAPQGGPPTLVVNPLAAYPSDPPPAAVSYNGSNHGNGFLNSGLLSGDTLGNPPKEFRAVFPNAGTFNYLCLVHGPDMSGTVNVTA